MLPDVHFKKVLPKHFNDTVNGVKPVEIRFMDTPYKVGDLFVGYEWTEETSGTGSFYIALITNVIDFPDGLKENYRTLVLELLFKSVIESGVNHV